MRAKGRRKKSSGVPQFHQNMEIFIANSINCWTTSCACLGNKKKRLSCCGRKYFPMQLQWFERKVMEVLSTDQMEYSHVINSQLRKKCETPLECDKLWEREIKSISFWIKNKYSKGWEFLPLNVSLENSSNDR